MEDKLVNVSVKLNQAELKELRMITAGRCVEAQGERVITVSDIIREALDSQFLKPKR